jgi:glycerophosphoryl diester phosphodiesterase
VARLVFLVSRAVSVLCVVTLLVAAVFDAQAARSTAGRAPAEFAKRLDPGLTGHYGRVIGVAHNAGDDTGAATRAVAYGADAIEIDVRSSGGELFASHDAPIPLLEDVFFRGPSLGEAWRVAQLRGTVLLHLKEHSPAYLERVRAFLLAHPRRRVIIQTARPSTLRWARRRLPFATRLLLVFDARRARALRTDPRLLADADGVSARESLLTRGLLAWLRRRHLTTFAWTVDDEARLNQLVARGVGGVITDRLDIMRLLGR